jgi:hypothetical protein
MLYTSSTKISCHGPPGIAPHNERYHIGTPMCSLFLAHIGSDVCQSFFRVLLVVGRLLPYIAHISSYVALIDHYVCLSHIATDVYPTHRMSDSTLWVSHVLSLSGTFQFHSVQYNYLTTSFYFSAAHKKTRFWGCQY